MGKLDEYMKNKGIEPKKKEKPSKAFNTLSANEKWALVEQVLRDLKYID